MSWPTLTAPAALCDGGGFVFREDKKQER